MCFFCWDDFRVKVKTSFVNGVTGIQRLGDSNLFVGRLNILGVTMPGLPRGLFWDLIFYKIQEIAPVSAFFGFQDRALREQKNRPDRPEWKYRRTRLECPRQNHEKSCIRMF